MASRSVFLRHLFLWSVYIAFEVEYLHVTVTTMASFSHFLIYYGLNIGLFYVNALLLLNYAFFRSRRPYLTAALLLIPELILYLGIKVLLDAALSEPALSVFRVLHLGKPYWMANLWRGVYFIGLSTAYFSTLYMIRFRDRNHQVETERLKSAAAQLELENRLISVENAYLQNQISPHLLFNSLNFIYNAVEEHSEKAAKGIAHLSDLMRYSLVSTGDQKLVPLDDEIRQVENLIALSRLRFGSRLHLSFHRSVQTPDAMILPLVLVTLVENMIKHGDLGEPAFPASIELKVSSGELSFITVNKKASAIPYLKTGIGLANLEKRLSNFYPGRYSLSIDARPTTFAVTLNVSL